MDDSDTITVLRDREEVKARLVKIEADNQKRLALGATPVFDRQYR